jgi:hypothetical protein
VPFEISTVIALVALAALTLLPGSILARPLTRHERDPLVCAGLAAGTGLALWPVVALWCDTLGLAYGPAVAWAVMVASLVAIVLRAIVSRRRLSGGAPPPSGPATPVASPSGPATPVASTAVREAAPATWRHPATIAVLVLLALLLAARWWAARAVTVPLWGDSVHHAMIVALFDAQAGLPDDWLPFAPLATFTYHFGLHALTALVAQLSGLPAHRALIVVGQGLMVLQALTAYALVAGLTGRRWAGFGAALAAAGLGTMPGFYLNWGRYTQLAGQVLLPVVALAAARVAGPRWAEEASDGPSGEASNGAAATGTAGDPGEPGGGATRAGGTLARSLTPPAGRRLLAAQRIALAALLVAGLALTHYLVTLFFVLFVLAWLLVGGVEHSLRPVSPLVRRVRALPSLSAIAAGGLLLAAPWIPRFLGGRLDNHAAALLTTELPDENVWGLPPPSYVWGNLSAFVGWPLVVAAGLGLGWAVYGAWRGRAKVVPNAPDVTGASDTTGQAGASGASIAPSELQRVAWMSCVWTLFLLVAAYPALIGLPITGPLKDFTVFIGLYLPLGLLVGVLAAELRRVGANGSDSVGANGPDHGAAPVPEPTTTARDAWTGRAFLAAAVLVAAVVTFFDRAVIDAQHVLATPADERAMDWISANTPAEATFLVSAGPAYGDTVVAGEDGGWWLSQLADRRTTLPPITYGLEPGIEPDWRQQVNALNAAWRADLDSAETERLLREEGVGWAYVGPTAKTLTAEALERSPDWERVYTEGGAAVYRAVWAEQPR